jgi:hypothetical protein
MSVQAARRMSALIAGFAVVAAACGGGGGDDTSGDVTLRSAGAIAVDADDVATTTTTEAVAATGGAGEADDVAASNDDVPAETTTTLPQEELDPGEALFEAVGVFQSCLDAEGYEFIGIPFQEETDPEAPVNQQPYIDALVACAARSQIQERIAEADAAQADLTPEEIEDQNRQFIAFRDCMVGRGWGIPDPVPNEQGLLFGGFGSTTSWVAPPGESLTSSDDVGECSSEAGVGAGSN